MKICKTHIEKHSRNEVIFEYINSILIQYLDGNIIQYENEKEVKDLDIFLFNDPQTEKEIKSAFDVKLQLREGKIFWSGKNIHEIKNDSNIRKIVFYSHEYGIITQWIYDNNAWINLNNQIISLIQKTTAIESTTSE